MNLTLVVAGLTKSVIQAKMRELGLSEDEKVYASLAIGYPDLPNGLNRREIEAKGYPVTYID